MSWNEEGSTTSECQSESKSGSDSKMEKEKMMWSNDIATSDSARNILQNILFNETFL